MKLKANAGSVMSRLDSLYVCVCAPGALLHQHRCHHTQHMAAAATVFESAHEGLTIIARNNSPSSLLVR